MAVLRRAVQVRGTVHRDQGHTETLGPVGRGLFRQVAHPRREPPLERRDLLRGDRELQPIVLERLEPFRMAHQLFQAEPVGTAGHVQVDEAIGAAEKRRRARLVVITATAFGRHLPGDEAAHDAVRPRYQHGMLRNIDELAPPTMQTPEQRGRDAQRRVHARFVVGQESARSLQRRLVRVGMARGVKAPAAGVKHVDALGVLELGGRPVAERGDRAEHHARMPVGPARGVVLDHRVRSADELVDAREVRLRGGVQGDGLLVGIEIAEQPTAFATVADDRRHGAGRTAAPGRLDLDDLGAEVGQQFPAVLPRDGFG